MKKLFYLFSVCLLVSTIHAQTSSNFTITHNSGSTVLTCSTLSLNFSASSLVNPPIHYSWASSTSSLTGANVWITQPGTYTVTIADSMHVVFGTQYLTVTSNTTPPNPSVSPNSQTIACNTAVGVPVSSNVSGSFTHTFVSPYGPSVVITGTAAYVPLGPGTYTHILVDNSNGCQSMSTFTLTSSQSFPTFSVTSPQNYTLGCGTKSIATINIVNASTSGPPGGPVSYTFMPLSESNPAPSGTLSAVSVYTVSTPGLYYVIVRDNTSLCASQIPVTILQNTTAPNVSVSAPTQVLNCNQTQIILNGTSTTANVGVSWHFVGTPGMISGNTVAVSSNANITQTLINTYTFVVTDLNNLCVSDSIIPIYQNLFPPTPSITSGAGYTLSCAIPTLVLTNTSTSGIPPSSGFPTNLPVVGFAWHAPLQASLSTSTTYTAATSGTYTLIVKDLNNGCTAQTTAVIFGDCNLVGLTKNSLSQTSISIFPNPTSGLVTLVKENNEAITTCEIYNSIGELVKKQNISSSRSTIDMSDLSNGMYTLRILQNNYLIQTSKLVKN